MGDSRTKQGQGIVNWNSFENFINSQKNNEINKQSEKTIAFFLLGNPLVLITFPANVLKSVSTFQI
jgi:hypothetical protein